MGRMIADPVAAKAECKRTWMTWTRRRWPPWLDRDTTVAVAACLVPLAIFTAAWGISWLLDYASADNWSYVKYFLDWTSPDPALRAWMDIDYKGSRVAWIIIGYIAYQVFGPLTGTMVLSAGVAACSIIAMLVLTSRLFGRAAGAVATLIMSAYGGMYSTGIPGFWSYHGAVCGLFYTVFLLALAELARRPGSRRWPVIAGFVGGLTVFTTTNYLVALPSAFVLWLLLRGLPSWREAIHALALVLLGLTLCFIVLMDANLWAGGQAFFIKPLLEATTVGSRGFGGRPLVAAWLPHATWLMFPFLVIIGGVATLVGRTPRAWPLPHGQGKFVAAFASFVTLVATHTLLNMRVGLFLEATHFAYVMVAPAALALAGVVRYLPNGANTPGRLPVYTLVLAALLLAVPQVAIGPYVFPEEQAALSAFVAPALLSAPLVISGLFGIAALLLLSRGLTTRWLLPSALSFGIAWNFVHPYGSHVTTPTACRLEREHFMLVLDVAEWLAARGIHGQPRSWFSSRDVQKLPAGCPDSSYYLDYLAIEQSAAIWRVSDPLREHLRDYTRDVMQSDVEARRRAFLVVLSPPETASALDRELLEWASVREVYIRPRPVRRETFTQGPLSLTVQVYGTGQRARRLRLEQLTEQDLDP
jgi:hypothetical protein